MGSVPSNSDSILWLQNRSLRADAVGWKAAVLSDFQSAGMAVPPGFILSPRYFQGFLQGGAWPVTAYSARQLWQLAEELQQQVDRLPFPPQWERSLREAYEQLRDRFPNTLYILRPSIGGIHTTGILESVVHSIGTTDAENLWLGFCEDLRSLYRQCFQARSLLYWQYHQQSLTRLPLAVLVQPLLPAVVTGTIEISPQDMRVSATWGMGLGLMRGESVPDRYGFRGSEPVTIHLGQKPWAYWHPETPVAVNCPVEVLSPALRSTLTLQKVYPEIQCQPVLTPAQLALLREEALVLLSLFADLGSLEWIFSPSRSNPMDFNLVWTQGTSRSLGDRTGEDRLLPDTLPDNTESHPDRLVNVATRPAKLIQGQGGSKGVQIGRVYGLEGLKRNDSSRDAFRESEPIILVAQQLTPAVFPWLTRVQGLVLAEGGLTSHGAILARELQIPAVVGVGSENVHYLLSQSWIRVDGTGGEVEVLPADPPIESGQIAGGDWPAMGASESGETLPQTDCSPRGISQIPTQVHIFATVNQVASLEALAAEPVEGVGLLRSEWFSLDLWEGQHPHCWITQGRQGELRQRLRDRLQACIQAIQPRSLFYRSVDCRAAELQSLAGQEIFPWTVGGTFAHCQDPRVLRLEFEVLHQIDRGGSAVHLVLPMVRTVAEFIDCRDRYRQFLEEQGFNGQRLETEKLTPEQLTPEQLTPEQLTPEQLTPEQLIPEQLIPEQLIPEQLIPESLSPEISSPEPVSLWVMVEVPSLLLQLQALAEAGAQGLVIGPGDLAHYLLGLDRERSGDLAHEVYHPIVHQVILRLLQEAKQLQLPILLCCHTETLPEGYLAAYIEAGLWGITAEVPHLRAWALQLAA